MTGASVSSDSAVGRTHDGSNGFSKVGVAVVSSSSKEVGGTTADRRTESECGEVARGIGRAGAGGARADRRGDDAAEGGRAKDGRRGGKATCGSGVGVDEAMTDRRGGEVAGADNCGMAATEVDGGGVSMTGDNSERCGVTITVGDDTSCVGGDNCSTKDGDTTEGKEDDSSFGVGGFKKQPSRRGTCSGRRACGRVEHHDEFLNVKFLLDPPGYGVPVTVPGLPVDPPGSPIFGWSVGKSVLEPGPDRVGCRSAVRPNKAVAAGVLQHIVECVGLDSSVCTAAVNLLSELLQENDRQFLAIPEEDCKWNETLCRKLKQQHGAITFLVVIILDKQFSESSKKVEDILFQLCFNDDNMILSVASYRWYKPLVQRLFDDLGIQLLFLKLNSDTGSESAKHRMMRGLLGMQLVEDDLEQLGEAGVIIPLIKLAMADDESKELAFSVMAKLSASLKTLRYIVEAGGFSIILEQMFSSQASPIIRENCSEICEKITSNGMEFITGSGVVLPNQEQMINKLLVMLPSPSTPIGIRKPAFRALLNISSSENAAAEKAVATPNVISNILPLLEDSDKEIQELTLKFVHRFSRNVPIGITDFLLDDRRLEAFMSFVKDDSQPESQILAVGLLSNLQKNNNQLIKRLAEFGTIPLLLNMLKRCTIDVNNNVLELLSGFTNPADIKMQESVVRFGAYPLLVDFLKSGSSTAKARAAALIGSLSSSSPKLTKMKDQTSCFCFPGKKVTTCEVHGGICSLESSFCLLDSGALPPLVRLLKERDDVVKLPAILALKTLVQEGCRGTNVLHQLGAIAPMLNLLSEQNSALIEEVLEILERVFSVRAVASNYSGQAMKSLIELSHNQNMDDHLRAKAAKILSNLEIFSKSGSYPV
ncbi:hypothetical protein KSP40_PGU012116 [Platanthera guangdongensis]|uniref:ARM repeat superfamily protein n=1 Tax=Platanthera guangdongensis TaxID=2320717 RepID=A0ABR2LYM5_9ASPA